MTKEIANRVLWAVLFVTTVWGTQRVLTIAVRFQDNTMLQQAMRCVDPKEHKKKTLLYSVQVVTSEGGIYSCRPPVKLR